MRLTKEDKELLLKDLCARLPYGVKIELSQTVTLFEGNIEAFKKGYHDVLMQYLRPMSSMTEEEIIEFNNIPSTKNYQIVKGDLPWDVAHYKQIDWLNAHHFDYRGLIDKGLAIKVTRENNPYKNIKL